MEILHPDGGEAGKRCSSEVSRCAAGPHLSRSLAHTHTHTQAQLMFVFALSGNRHGQQQDTETAQEKTLNVLRLPSASSGRRRSQTLWAGRTRLRPGSVRAASQ